MPDDQRFGPVALPAPYHIGHFIRTTTRWNKSSRGTRLSSAEGHVLYGRNSRMVFLAELRRRRREVDGWPAVVIERPSRRVTHILPWSAFPTSFKHDVDLFLERLSGKDLSEDGPPRPARPSTLQKRAYQLRLAASALIHRGHKADTVHSIADLLSLERYQEILRFFLDRHGGKTSQQIAPNVTRVGVLRDADQPLGVAYLAAIQSVAPSLGIEVSSIGVCESEIERAVTAFAGSSNRGLIMSPTPYTAPVRNLIIALAARHKLPTVYYQRFLVAAGGLASYGPNFFDEYRRAAGYVSRILKGEKAADLPVQLATKHETVINLKTAKSLGLDVPSTLLAIADEVIE